MINNNLWPIENINSFFILGKPLSFYGKEYLKIEYPWDLLEIKRKIFDKYFKEKISNSAKICSNVIIKGGVCIGDNVEIKENVVINGPAYIGSNSVIGNNSLIREYSNIESDALIGFSCEIKNSILQKDVHLHSTYVGDSIIGKGARIGAGTVFANTRMDRGEINSFINSNKTNTKLKKLGAILGNSVKIGTHCSLMPGILIESNSSIWPHSLIAKNIKK